MACCSATLYSVMMRSGRGCMRSAVELLWPGLFKFVRLEAMVLGAFLGVLGQMLGGIMPRMSCMFLKAKSHFEERSVIARCDLQEHSRYSHTGIYCFQRHFANISEKTLKS